MIDIQTDFPFAFCRTCQRMDIKTNQTKIYSWDQVLANTIQVGCQNEKTCQYLVEEIRRNGLKNMQKEAGE